MAESVHRKLERVRPPRVHITYDVEIGDAIQMKEIPFVMGVLGDFSGSPAEALPRLKDRKFVEVTPDNFDDVLKSMKPRLQYKVENKLSEEAGKIGVELKFESLDDFSPDGSRSRWIRCASCSSCGSSWRTCAAACRATTSSRRSFRRRSTTPTGWQS
jgi:predicted component of type VI protein secretion system